MTAFDDFFNAWTAHDPDNDTNMNDNDNITVAESINHVDAVEYADKWEKTTLSEPGLGAFAEFAKTVLQFLDELISSAKKYRYLQEV